MSPSHLCRYVVVSSYLYLRDNAGIAHPENLLLVFGVSLVSDFFMLSTLVFGGVYYLSLIHISEPTRPY